MLQNWLNESVVFHVANESHEMSKVVLVTLLAQSDSPVLSVGLRHKCICYLSFLSSFFFFFLVALNLYWPLVVGAN